MAVAVQHGAAGVSKWGMEQQAGGWLNPRGARNGIQGVRYWCLGLSMHSPWVLGGHRRSPALCRGMWGFPGGCLAASRESNVRWEV